jgi:hypothetical protein
MAESVDMFLKRNPEYQVVVLAGNGICFMEQASRSERRCNGYDYAIILNESEIEKGISDYVSPPARLIPGHAQTHGDTWPPPERPRSRAFRGEHTQKAGMKVGTLPLFLMTRFSAPLKI